MKVAVVGAGPAGITAAYALAQGGAEVEVFEAADGVGGLARSLRLWGQTVDLGPHRFFSSDARVNRLWLDVVGDDYRMVDRLTRVYYAGKFFRYPLKPVEALFTLGLVEASRSVASYLMQKVRGSASLGEEPSLEHWVVSRFGRRLFEIFFKTYSEKLWGIPCSQLDADFAAQRIKRFSLGEAMKAALGMSKGRHKTLVDRFAYPLEGTGMVYERMARAIEAGSGRVHLNCPVAKVTPRKGAADVTLGSGETSSFDRVVSTMPLNRLVQGLDGAPPDVREAASCLTYRSTVLVYLQVDATDLFPDQWLYIHAPELRLGRVTNFRNWVPHINGDDDTSILALEYWADEGDAFWSQADEELAALAEAEARQAGLLADAPVRDTTVYHMPGSYPVYRRGYRKHVEAIAGFLKDFPTLVPIGRSGSFKYNNQDHSILMGLLAAEDVLHGTNHNLWDINTDYDVYQEQAVITEKGLEIFAK